jgi:hypothetical protein
MDERHSTRPERPAGIPDADPAASSMPHIPIPEAAVALAWRAGLVYVNLHGGVDREAPLPIVIVDQAAAERGPEPAP